MKNYLGEELVPTCADCGDFLASDYAAADRSGCERCAECEKEYQSFEAWVLTLPESDRLMVRVARDAERAYIDGMELDAGFDGGEFSGPAAHRAHTRTLTDLAAKYGRTLDELRDLMLRAEHYDSHGEYYGYGLEG